MGQHHNTAMGAHGHKSVFIVIWPYMLLEFKTTTNKEPLESSTFANPFPPNYWASRWFMIHRHLLLSLNHHIYTSNTPPVPLSHALSSPVYRLSDRCHVIPRGKPASNSMGLLTLVCHWFVRKLWGSHDYSDEVTWTASLTSWCLTYK